MQFFMANNVDMQVEIQYQKMHQPKYGFRNKKKKEISFEDKKSLLYKAKKRGKLMENKPEFYF